MTDRDSTQCFVCGSGCICEHRERELVPYYERLGLASLTLPPLPPVKYRVDSTGEALEVAIPRKRPAIAQIARKRDSLAQGAEQRAPGCRSGYSALRGW